MSSSAGREPEGLFTHRTLFEGISVAQSPASVEEEEEEEVDDFEGIDHFDRLPDSVILVVFNHIGDVKALGRCCVVSRRFHSLIPFVDDVVVRVDCVISDEPSPASSSAAALYRGGVKPRGFLSNIARLVIGGLAKPLVAIGQILTPLPSSSSSSAASISSVGGRSSCSRRSTSSSPSSSSSSSSEVSHHSPTDVLRSFKEIRRLRIELPAGELGIDDGLLLKWKAEFGSTLDRCVILSASSVFSSSIKTKFSNSNSSYQEDTESIPESFYTNGSLKLRVVWTISSLIAASARHYLLQPIIAEHQKLESLDLTDADGQGVLSMDRRELQELWVKSISPSGSSQRTLLPALSMRLWYAPQLELPGGVTLNGATLVAIRPAEERARESAHVVGCGVGSSDECWVSNAFEEPYRTAAKTLMKRRTYCLEMNSF